jgi:hypothetical protein
MATGSGPYYRVNDSSWISDKNSLYQLNIQQIIPCDDTIYALLNDKMYFSLNPSSGFETLETNWICNPRYIKVTDSLWYAGSDSGFLISDNSGYSWDYYYDGIFNKRVNDVAVNQEYCFASRAGLYRAHKDTMFWRRVPNWIGNANVYYVCTLDSVLFVSVYCEGVYRSVDNGNSFQHIAESNNNTSKFTIVDTTIYMYEYNNVYFSDDLGFTWDIYKEVGSGVRIGSMDVVNETSVIGGRYMPPPSSGIYLIAHSPLYPNGLVINDNLSVNIWPIVNEIKIIDDFVLISTNSNSIWYRNDLSVNVPENNIPSAEELPYNIFPNPSTDYITLNTDGLIWNSSIRLTVYSFFGQKIVEYEIHEWQNQIRLNTSSYTPGLYVIVLRNNRGIIGRRKFVKSR